MYGGARPCMISNDRRRSLYRTLRGAGSHCRRSRSVEQCDQIYVVGAAAFRGKGDSKAIQRVGWKVGEEAVTVVYSRI